MAKREPSIARRLRSEYEECTRQLENHFWLSTGSKSGKLQWMLRIFSEWFEHGLHENKSVDPLTTEQGIAAFNAALAEVLPALQLSAAMRSESNEEKHG